MDFRTFLQKNIVVFDGAFGTLLQKKAPHAGTIPEQLNLENPALIAEIHRAYVQAGADVITANTFGANEIKVGSRERSRQLIRAAIDIARKQADAAIDIARKQADAAFVALDVGPIGKLLQPMGELSFEQAYSVFADVVNAGKEGADLVLIETMADLQELRAALLAARENCDLPVVCSMTFEENGRTFAGCDPVCYAMTASPLADAVGVNCSLGPEKLLPVVRTILRYTDKPVIVQANAGLPDANLCYDVSPEQFAQTYATFLKEGVRIVGGCCGTTPEYTARLRALADATKPVKRKIAPCSGVCSARKAVFFDGVRVIGERINPTGKKAMKQALLDENYGFVRNQAIEQSEAGADILDVNAGLPELDERTVLAKLVQEVQAATDLPLQIDCGKADAIEAALRVCCGKAIVNSVNGEDKTLHAILPLVKRYGAAVVGLTMDERGIPKTARQRVEIAEKIIRTCADYGIPQEDILIDCLTLTVSAEQEQAEQTLLAMQTIKRQFRVHTVLGVSNISFGLPNRQIINTAFLTAALFSGLDCPILNPNIPENRQAIAAYRALSGQDKHCADYTKTYSAIRVATSVDRTAPAQETESRSSAPAQGSEPPSSARAQELSRAIRKGMNDAGALAAEMLETMPPLELIEQHLIPALNAVGDAYEKGTLFLPQLIAAAESAKLCFAEVKKRMPEGSTARGKIVLATVLGDIHDIGKNIAKTVLENYGYQVLDLGKNVPPETIALTCEREQVRLCGLSALMTTTVPSMEATIRLLRQRCPDCRVMVGGAVLNADYAKKIGADWYCKDANADVKIAQFLFDRGEPVPTL